MTDDDLEERVEELEQQSRDAKHIAQRALGKAAGLDRRLDELAADIDELRAQTDELAQSYSGDSHE